MDCLFVLLYELIVSLLENKTSKPSKTGWQPTSRDVSAEVP